MITKKADRLQINTKIYQYIKVMSSHDHAKIPFLFLLAIWHDHGKMRDHDQTLSFLSRSILLLIILQYTYMYLHQNLIAFLLCLVSLTVV